MSTELVIRTSAKTWLADLASAYKHKTPTTIINDADFDIDPSRDTIFDMGRKVSTSTGEWKKIWASLGVSGLGLVLILLAMIDPEPTSKLTLIFGGGVLLTVTGAGSLLYVVVGTKPPIIEASQNGWKVAWGTI